MRGRAHRRAVLSVVCATLLLPALAQADDIALELDAVVVRGKVPALTLVVRRKVRHLLVTLASEQGGSLRFERRGLRRGARLRVPVKLPAAHPIGRALWQGSLQVTFADGGEGEMPLSFTTSNEGPLRLTARGTREGLLAGRLPFGVDRLPVTATLTVQGLRGGVLVEQKVSFGDGDDPSKLTMIWTPPALAEGDEVVKIALKVEDASGWHNGVAYFPWQVQIPHEEVNFPSGESKILKTEAPKLVAVLAKIREMARRYGSTGDAILWIAGHTDTVAAPDFNLALSDARARAIGRFFRKAGIRLPIRTRGFGESSLLLATPDETDEPQNRRAEYVLSAEDPYAQQALAGTWKVLR